ncbi:MAG: hypothetical protein U0892_05410 [Pirellulales bacterium]
MKRFSVRLSMVDRVCSLLGRCAARCTTVAVFSAALFTATIGTPITLLAQRPWPDPLRSILDDDALKATEAEGDLRKLLRSPDRTEEMALALALSGVNRNDPEIVRVAITGLKQVFPDPRPETTQLVNRLRLWYSLSGQNTSDPATAFMALVKPATDGSLDPKEAKLHIAMLGAVAGMLDPEESGSPIRRETIAQTEQLLAQPQHRSLLNAYKAAQDTTRDRARGLAETIARVQSIGIEAAEKELADLGFKFVEMGIAAKDAAISARELIRNAREIRNQNIKDSRKLETLVRRIDLDAKIPTPGHPGTPPIEPRLPNKSDIHVDEYKEVRDGYVEKTDSQGNKTREPKYKNERRSQSEIDRERSEKFAGLMQQYQVLKAQYDRYLAVYQQSLASWIETDTKRREDLKKKREEAVARQEELAKEIAAVKEEKEAAAREASSQRSEAEVLVERYEWLEISVKAIKENRVPAAFRTANFDIMNLVSEQQRLLALAKTRSPESN